MTTARKIEIFGVFVILLLAACFLRGWFLEHEAGVKAQATADAMQQQIAASAAAIQSRDKIDAAYSQALAAQASHIQTPQQAAQVIVHYLPAPTAAPGVAPVPQTIATVDRADLPPALQKDLPVAPSYGILTEAQLKQVAQNDLTCDAAGHTLTTCQADKASLSAELAASQKESAAWESAAKGGSKFKRFLRVAKFIGCAGLGSAAGAIADKKSPAIGSAVGAAAGVTTCSIF